MPAEDPPTNPALAARLRMLAAFVLAVIPAIAYSLFFGDIPPQDDAGEYWRLGSQWHGTGIYGTREQPEAYWPPGYPAFIAAACALVGEEWRAVAALNLVWHLLTVAVVGFVACRAFGERVAPAAMVLFGWVWDIATLPAVLLSENTFDLLLIGGVALMIFPGSARWRVPAFFAAGLLWGLGALTRGNIIGLPFFLLFGVLAWWPWPLRRRLHAAALMLVLIAGYLAPIAAWAHRNYKAYGMLIPVSLNSGEILALSFNPLNTWWYLSPDDPRRVEMGLLPGDAKGNYKRGRDVAIKELREHPFRSAAKALPKIWWTFTGQLPWFANRDINAVWGREYYLFESAIYWQWTVFVLLVLGGLLLYPNRTTAVQLLLLGVAAYWVAFHGAIKVVPRYRIPLVPIMAIYAGVFWACVVPRLAEIRALVAARVRGEDTP